MSNAKTAKIIYDIIICHEECWRSNPRSYRLEVEAYWKDKAIEKNQEHRERMVNLGIAAGGWLLATALLVGIGCRLQWALVIGLLVGPLGVAVVRSAADAVKSWLS